MELEIGHDIRRSETLPGWVYGDEGVYRAQLDALFANSWLSVPTPPVGTDWVHPFTLLPGALDEPLLWTRDAAGQAHCLSNVCTHRGMLVACEAGKAKRLRCGYHGRRFGMDGRFEAAPGFDGALDFPRPTDDLPPVETASWGPLWFARLGSAPAFGDWFSMVESLLGWMDKDSLELDLAAGRDYTVAANWMLYLDNYLEGMHLPTVHPTLARALDVGAYRTETFGHGSVAVGVLRDAESAIPLPSDHRFAGEMVGGIYIHLFPNTLINAYPWGLSVNHVEPVGPARTRVRFVRYRRCPGPGETPILEDTGAGADLHRVEQEDEAVVAATQVGVRARLYDRGRYSPQHEQGVHHFHRWLAERMR